MGKRCLEGCPCLAQDGTCLLPVKDMPERCPKRETVRNEQKDDEWMLKRHFLVKPEKNVRF